MLGKGLGQGWGELIAAAVSQPLHRARPCHGARSWALGGGDTASSDECKSWETTMETHLGEEEEEEEEKEEATFNHSRCSLGFQGLAQKTHPDWLQRSWSSRLEGRRGAGAPL